MSETYPCDAPYGYVHVKPKGAFFGFVPSVTPTVQDVLNGDRTASNLATGIYLFRNCGGRYLFIAAPASAPIAQPFIIPAFAAGLPKVQWVNKQITLPLNGVAILFNLFVSPYPLFDAALTIQLP